MSRTYRRGMKRIDCGCGAPIYQGRKYNENYYIRKDEAPYRECHHHFYDYYSRHNVKRDVKNWFKQNRIWKIIMKRERRAKERDALVQAHKTGLYENIPIFRQEDQEYFH